MRNVPHPAPAGRGTVGIDLQERVGTALDEPQKPSNKRIRSGRQARQIVDITGDVDDITARTRRKIANRFSDGEVEAAGAGKIGVLPGTAGIGVGSGRIETVQTQELIVAVTAINRVKAGGTRNVDRVIARTAKNGVVLR